ncbi:MAG: hypothetical protein ACRD51_11185 [Candidatus Acidiferrum sp.]
MSALSSVQSQEPPAGMSQLVSVPEANATSSSSSPDHASRGHWLCSQLEAGNILFFPNPPFVIHQDDRNFLLGRT